MAVTIGELAIADPPEAWEALGMRVEGGACRIGSIVLRLAGPGAGRGIVGWTLRGLPGSHLDGLPVEGASGDPPAGDAPEHPLGVTRVDHVVAMSPDLDRTITALEAAGLDLRRVREEPTPAGEAPRQAFFRLGEAILEVIQQPSHAVADPAGPARLWGLALVGRDLDAAAARLGARAKPVRDAVQPGRRIMPLAREAGLSLPVALMTE